MKELVLKFIDAEGEEQRISVEQDEFVIGRHSENDLAINLSNLSRQHLKIQRFAEVFIVTDLDSSNGSKLNGAELDEPTAIENGDALELGGFEISAEFPDEIDNEDSEKDESEKESADAASSTSSSVSSQTSSSSGFGKALILAPIFGLFILFSLLGTMYMLAGKSGDNEIVKNTERDPGFVRTSSLEDDDPEDDPVENNSSIIPTQTPLASETPEQKPASSSPIPNETPLSVPETIPEPIENDDIGNTRVHSFRFLRKIARSNQKPVLLSNQLSLLDKKIKSVSGSRALAQNIKNAQSNAAQIQALARTKNLKPQFLVTAALAKLGNTSGNVFSKANEMADILDNLNIQIGDEQADDNLIVIAAYNEGQQNQFLKMRNRLQRLANKNQSRASEIRTIWFLKEKGEISPSQFDLALRFLAIGTITQNPEAFNVKAKALNLN